MVRLMSLLSTSLSFLVGMSLIAAIHELGHLLMAKWCGMRVRRYMVFFPPTLWQWRWRDTVYGIGSIPLGGFVEVEGMGEDPSEGFAEQDEGDFRTKPAWQRALVMAGGILFNLGSAYFMILCLLMATGASYLSKEDLNEHGIYPTALGKRVGLRRGDRIVRVNGHGFTRSDELERALDMGSLSTYTVFRGTEEVEIAVTDEVQKVLEAEGGVLWEPLVPYAVHKVVNGSAAALAGLEGGDEIVSMGGRPTLYLQDFEAVLAAHQGGALRMVYVREGEKHTAEVLLPEGGKLGVELVPTLRVRYRSYGWAEGLWTAYDKVGRIITLQLRGIGKIVRGEVAWQASIQSPVAIAGMFGDYEGWTGFWWLIAFLSIILALMNLLPIPALDGFHLLIHLGEAVTGKRVPYVWYMRIQTVGMVLLLAFTGLLVLKDVWRLWGG